MAIIKSIGIAAAALTITALTAGPSTAQGFGHTDPTGDMVHYSDVYDFTTNQRTVTGPTVAPAHTNGDIVALTARHRAHRVTATIRLVDLRAMPNAGPTKGGTEVRFRTETGAGRVRDVVMFLDGSQRSWSMHRGLDGAIVRCPFTHNFDAVSHTAHVSVPRSCLGRPKVVRVGAQAGTVAHTVTDTSQTNEVYLDSALRIGAADFYGRPALGPWLKHD